jgi:hypothetical protein
MTALNRSYSATAKANFGPPNGQTPRQKRLRRLLLPIIAIVTLLSALPSAMPLAQAKDSIKIKKATLAKAITDDFQVKNPTTKFYGTEAVYLLAQVKGRPKSGTVEARWSFRGESVGTASVDLSSVNKGLLFSFGEDTYVKFHLKPGADELYIGGSYVVEVFANGVSSGKYKFSIVPPAKAIPSEVTDAYTSKTEGGAEVTKFAPTDKVFLSFVGDFGTATWLEGEWFVNGKVAPEGTRSLRLSDNNPEVDGSFSFLPKGGWPKGNHAINLVMNDELIGTFKFTVA